MDLGRRGAGYEDDPPDRLWAAGRRTAALINLSANALSPSDRRRLVSRNRCTLTGRGRCRCLDRLVCRAHMGLRFI